ncbi:uncharacterized protein LOC117100447 [Anneissia japonica]|uniref:uncharacterized protein LOC117100447 n=1 Tax=Anneissia japonica TaxID=1529436 RepID=UPI00142555C9|nr:uncharacterized protein LOC117100447 [Anneissia japonica]
MAGKVPPSFTSIGLYIRSGQLQLPKSSVVEKFKIAKCRLVMTIRDSKDRKVSQAGIEIQTGRKWSAEEVVENAESSLKLRDIIGNHCIGRQCLGTSHFQQWNKANIKEKRDMGQKATREREDEVRKSRGVELGAQGAWTKWELPQRRLTWAEVWRMEPYRISFFLLSVYDTLPTPTNLCLFGLKEDPLCKLCVERGTLSHILSGCKTALTQGRYIGGGMTMFYRRLHRQWTKNVQKRPRRINKPSSIAFVKRGEKTPTMKETRETILQLAHTWEFQVDLGKRLQFPQVVYTTLRPDAVLWSTKSKKLIMVALSVPWEENCEIAYERKRAKYQDLLDSCKEKGWQTWLYPIEVGCGGFPAQSVWKFITAIGLSGNERKRAVKKLGEEGILLVVDETRGYELETKLEK